MVVYAARWWFLLLTDPASDWLNPGNSCQGTSYCINGFFVQGVMPLAGGFMLLFALVWSAKDDWNFASGQSYTSWTMPFSPHWQIGGAFIIIFFSAVVGWLVYLYCRTTAPAFFRKETLTRATPTLVPDE